MTTKREAAHDAVRRGFRTFPVAPDSKVPLLKENWREIASLDHAQIDAWWDQCPDANIAGVTDDKLVFDIDPRNGGLPTLDFLKLLYDFPKTARSETAGGGAHVIYQMPAGESVKGGTHLAGPGVDIKARGGYILLPGSTIGEKEYRWTNDREIGFPPGWAVDMCAAARERTNAAGQRIIEEDDQARQLAEQWLEQRAPTAQHGEIDDTTYKVAARLYDFGCSLETVHELMSEWNETHCFPPGDTDRLEIVCESAGRNRDNAIGSKHPSAPGFEAIEIDESAKPATEKCDGAVTLPPRRIGQFLTIPAHEAAALALTNPSRPLIKGLLDRGTLSVLYGAPGGGKSFFSMDLAYHVATGTPLAGMKVHKGAVIYVAAEGGEGVFARLAALQKHYGALDTAALHILPSSIDLLHGPKGADMLIAEAKRLEALHGDKVELIIFDTIARVLAGGDENSGQDMGALIQNLDRIRLQTDAHVMGIHHTGKNRAAGARGHSSLLGAVDTEIEIDNKVLTITKQRDMGKDVSLRFDLPAIRIGVDLDGDEVVSCFVQLKDGKGGEPLADLPPYLDDIMTAIDTLVGDDRTTKFGWQKVEDSMRKIDRNIGLDRTTYAKYLLQLGDFGYIKKVGRNQWVVSNVTNVMNVMKSSD